MVSEDEDFIPPDQLQKVQSEDEDLKYATKDEDEDEGRTEDEDAMPSTSPQKRGPGQLPAMKKSKEEHAKILEAERIIAEAKKTELLAAADVVLARQERRKQMTALEDAKKLFEANKDEAGVKAVSERLTVMKAEIDAETKPKTSTVQGAQIPASTPQLGIPPVEKKPEDFVTQFWNTPGTYNGATAQSFSAQRRKALDAAFNAELVPNLRRRFGRVNA
jgi:hypothetical protein